MKCIGFSSGCELRVTGVNVSSEGLGVQGLESLVRGFGFMAWGSIRALLL